MGRRQHLLLLLAASAIVLALSAAAAGSPPARPGASRYQVEMTGNRFTPATLIIAAGDTVDFVNGLGGPHNVAFWPESLSTAAAASVAAAMPDTIGPLMGPLLFTPGQSQTIILSGVPDGRYPYYCLPHLAGGMTGVIEVHEAR